MEFNSEIELRVYCLELATKIVFHNSKILGAPTDVDLIKKVSSMLEEYIKSVLD